jgi:serine/threonine protein phosphatase PrpC
VVRLVSSFVQRKNSELDKPLEDVCSCRPDSGAFCVADGITRSRDALGRYPCPSPGKRAAEIAVGEIINALCSIHGHEKGSEKLLRIAFHNANTAIGSYARMNGPHDFHFHDLPGTTATCALIRGMRVGYGHVGDGTLVRMSNEGAIARLTSNQTAKAEAWFQARSYLNREARNLISRRHFRNRPKAECGYGALTGEPIALEMVEYGVSDISVGDRLLLFSDGMSHWFARILVDLRFARVVRHWLDEGKLENVVDSAENEEKRWRGKADDKTLLVIAVG